MMDHPESVLSLDTGNRSALDQVCINALRVLAMDAVQQANSGHPGLPLGAAPMVYVLWTRYLRHNPANPSWPDRDRFVLSAGHGSMLLYSLLYLAGYDLSLYELKHFRQWGSRAPGHPERGLTPGVETTTGPLGQGFANGVGLAIAARFHRPVAFCRAIRRVWRGAGVLPSGAGAWRGPGSCMATTA